MQAVRFAHGAVCPVLVLLHHNVAADGPVVFAFLFVVVVRAPEVRTDRHHQAVGDASRLGVLPQEVHAVGELGQRLGVGFVVVAVGVEAADVEVCTHRHSGLEGGDGKLSLHA